MPPAERPPTPQSLREPKSEPKPKAAAPPKAVASANESETSESDEEGARRTTAAETYTRAELHGVAMATSLRAQREADALQAEASDHRLVVFDKPEASGNSGGAEGTSRAFSRLPTPSRAFSRLLMRLLAGAAARRFS